MGDRAERVAVVSGASRGIGKEIVRGLARAGLDVVATSRGEEGRAVAEALGARWLPLDVTRAESIEALAAQLPFVDVLVNNAGVALDGFDAKVVERTLAVNLFGAMHLTDALLPRLRAGARVVNVSSGLGELSGLSGAVRARFEDPSLDRAGLVALVEAFERDVRAGTHAARGWPSSAYRISKVALNAYTRLLAAELADDPRGICVNAVCPGWVATDMGGPGAPRTPAEGAATPIWLATAAPADLRGRFVRDRHVIPF